MRKLLIITLTIFCLGSISAQKKGERETIKISATINESPESVTLSWAKISTVSNYRIYKRNDLDTAQWGSPVKVNMVNDTTFTDSDVLVGEGYEYYVTAGSGNSSFHGYAYSGIKKQADFYMGNTLLLIDEAYKNALSSEISRLEEDLLNEGWNVTSLFIPRTMSVQDVKSSIDVEAKNLDNRLKTIFIIGHVPVPYSGDYGGDLPPPDGHVVGSGGHTGAWSADTYYACFDGNWTDTRVNNTTGSRSRNYNIVGDGKLDQSRLPGNVNYELGRVDLFDMPAFSKSDTELVRDYLNRNHSYRRGKAQTIKRALVDDNFGSLNLSSTGWNNFTSFYTPDSVTSKDYFTEMKTAPYQWSYGCGAGSYTSCSGVGRTSDFAADTLQSIFTILAGSYFGDWDIRNNLLKAPLANSALVSFWGGIPKWYIHTMALGKNIGFGAKESMNNRGDYFTGNFNSSHNGAHMALMGDPTLKLNYIQPPTNASGTSADNKITLSWNAAPGQVDGYHVYRVFDYQRTTTQLSKTPITELSFVDSTNRSDGSYSYIIRAVKYDTTNSGSYELLSPGINTAVEFKYENTVGITDLNKDNVMVYPNPASDVVHLKLVLSKDQTAYANLLDISGKIILSQQINAETTSDIDVSGLQNGVYHLAIKVGAQTLNKALVISK